MKILDLACGPNRIDGALGIDSNPRVNPDVLHDLDHFPYPFDDDTFAKVVCFNGIEHLPRPLDVLREVARISQNGAELLITTPHFTSPDAYTDPTHSHAMTSRSFDYLIAGTDLCQLDYGDPCFVKEQIHISFIDLPRGLRWVVSRMANRNLLRYERRWAYLFPGHQLIFKLRIAK